jgi:hypothetical protein
LGGRSAGTPNKRTQDVIERLEALKCDPIEGMARIAMDANNPPELRGRMFAELAQYIAPKRKALEHSGEISHTYAARVPTGSKTMDEWQKQHADHLNNQTLQ